MIRIENLHSCSQAETHPPTDTLLLPFDGRGKSRQLVELASGEVAQLLLPHGTRLKEGDLLAGSNGELIVVKAAAQRVLIVSADSEIQLTRIAYHLGNRHTPVQIEERLLVLEEDPVLEEMIARLGGQVEKRERPFEPEPGAYGGGHRHGTDDDSEREIAQRVFHLHDH
ncbi:MAG: urease accessory protein UreE [Verrucomicrobia bacterium]|nr:urease accessory protein UreE [Verrucomicrobiota bacterium]